jgi:homoserine acetyltransferase
MFSWLKSFLLIFKLVLRILLILINVVATWTLAFSQTTPERQRNYPAPVEGDYTINDFKFRSGETLPELKLHYSTIGTPAKDNSGVTRNAVLIMHGTGGTGAQFLGTICQRPLWARSTTRRH